MNQEINPLVTFKTQLEAVDFLCSQGYKVGKSTFNNHLKEGLVCTNEDGVFHKSTLLGYAVNNLKSTVITGDTRAMEMQINRAGADADLKHVKAQREFLRLQKEQGAVMLIADHEKDLAARAVFFKHEIQGFIHRKGHDIIDCVGGNENFYAKLVHFWENETADWMDAWSEDREFLEVEENLFDDIETQTEAKEV